MVYAIPVGLRRRGAPFRQILKHDLRFRHRRARRIGHDAGDFASGLGLRIHTCSGKHKRQQNSEL